MKIENQNFSERMETQGGAITEGIAEIRERGSAAMPERPAPDVSAPSSAGIAYIPATAADQEALFLESINAVCADIYDIYSYDCATGIVTAVRQSGEADGLENFNRLGLSYDTAVSIYVKNNVFEKDRERLLQLMRMENVMEALRKEDNISAFYRTSHNGELRDFRMKCVRIGDAEHIRKIVFAFMPEDFRSSRSEMLQELEKDDVTGVYTRKAFFHLAAELLDRNPDKNYDLIISDVDNFKLINRVYGRTGGDDVLKYLAGRYALAARGGLCGRYSSDRFAIFTESLTDPEMNFFRGLTEKLRLEAPVPYLMVHYGFNRRVDRNDTVAEMCDKAMIALRNKNKSDDPVILYDQEVARKHYRALMYELNFERALKNGEFVVWAQPKYNTFHRGMTSAEALVRWKTEDGKFITPGEFIPVFEADGLIVQLDEYVFRYVCGRQKEQLRAGMTPLPVSVNLSRATLFRRDTVAKYSAIIAGSAVPKELVPLELTESATVDNVEINGLIRELKAAGFVLHLDDFGSGYSSLASLSELHMDVLKLDKSLIDGIGNTGGDEILRHIIELAHFFQMEVVAEGVEKEEQHSFLKKLSCDTIQGYLFSRPVPFDEYLQLRREQPAVTSDTMDGAALADQASVGSLRITNDLRLQYLSALARIYMTMHVIDLKEDTVVEFATTTNVKEFCNRAHNCAAQMKAAMSNTVAPEYVDAVLRFTDLTTVRERMRGKKTISEEFVGKHFGWFRARFIVITTDENEEPEKLIYTTQVIEADRRGRDQTVRSCRTDELTGVYNRAAFEEDAGAMKVTPDLVVMSADINGLRAANDRFGRAAGDELVWGTADCLNTVLGKGSTIYRMESDRFIAFFHGGQERVDKVRFDFEKMVRNWIGNEIRSLSVSCGFAAGREFPGEKPDGLIAIADSRRMACKAKLAESAGR